MIDHSIAISSPSFSPATVTMPVANRPIAARTRLLLEGPVLSTLLRLSAPNVLNLLAITGMITFDALFLGRLGADALAGVSLAFPFVMLMQHAANGGVGGGVSSAIARARRRSPRSRRRSRLSHVPSGAGSGGVVLNYHAARRAPRVSMYGRTRRDVVRCPLPIRTWRSAARYRSAC